jgi:hypothetical protein
MIYPEPEKGGRGKKSKALNSAVSAGFSSRRVNEARSVLHHSRDLADSVIKGSISLDEALAKVEELKQQANSTEAKQKRLQKDAPRLSQARHYSLSCFSRSKSPGRIETT